MAQSPFGPQTTILNQQNCDSPRPLDNPLLGTLSPRHQAVTGLDLHSGAQVANSSEYSTVLYTDKVDTSHSRILTLTHIHLTLILPSPLPSHSHSHTPLFVPHPKAQAIIRSHAERFASGPRDDKGRVNTTTPLFLYLPYQVDASSHTHIPHTPPFAP